MSASASTQSLPPDEDVEAEMSLDMSSALPNLYDGFGTLKGLATSTNTHKGRDSALRAYDKFAEYFHLPSFENTTAEDFCDPERMDKFAKYLIEVYTKEIKYKEKDEDKRFNIMKSTVLNYLSRIMSLGNLKFNKTHSDFFKVMGGKNSPIKVDNWYNDLNDEITTVMVRR